MGGSHSCADKMNKSFSTTPVTAISSLNLSGSAPTGASISAPTFTYTIEKTGKGRARLMLFGGCTVAGGTGTGELLYHTGGVTSLPAWTAPRFSAGNMSISTQSVRFYDIGSTAASELMIFVSNNAGAIDIWVRCVMTGTASSGGFVLPTAGVAIDYDIAS